MAASSLKRRWRYTAELREREIREQGKERGKARVRHLYAERGIGKAGKGRRKGRDARVAGH